MLTINDMSYPQEIKSPCTSKEFMKRILDFKVPSQKTALWTLGQNGYILKTSTGRILVIDPYLTDFCASGRTKEHQERSRFLPVFIEPEDLVFDDLFITHSHTDHADPFTLERLTLTPEQKFYASFQAAEIMSDSGIPRERITLLHPRQTLTLTDYKVTGTYAHPTDSSDLNHMGFLFDFDGAGTYLNSGDTAFSPLLNYLSEYKIDFMTICINGGYHNLSFYEAAELTARIKPVTAAPAHYDVMPHNFQPPGLFREALNKMAPEINYIQLPYGEPFLF